MVNVAEVTAEIVKVKETERQENSNSDNEVMCPFSHALISLAARSVPRSPLTQPQTQMADPELAALRAARLNQLQQSGTDGSSQSGASSEEVEKRRAEEQMRRDLLATALEPAARERRMSNCLLGRILCREWPMHLQCPVLRSYLPRGRIRSSLSSCGWYNLASSGDVSASNNSSICLNRYGCPLPPGVILMRKL